MPSEAGAEVSVGPYRLSYDEYMSVHWAAKTSAVIKIYNAVMCGLLGLALELAMWGIFVFILRAALGPLSDGAVVGAIVVAGILAILLVFRVIGPAVARHQFVGLTASRQDYTVRLDEWGIAYTCGKISASLPWDTLDRVADKRGCILLFLDDLMAVIVPRRAFANQPAADAFLSFAQTHIKRQP